MPSFPDMTIEQKLCNACLVEKPVTDFYRRTSGTGRFQSECKKCFCARSKRRREARSLEDPAFVVAERERRAKWRREHPDYDHEYYEANREALLAAQRDRRADPVIRQKQREYSRAHYEKNRDEYMRRARRWYRDNPERARLLSREGAMRRYARMRAAEVGDVSYERVLERDGPWCYLCESEVAPGDLNFDHVVPLSRGGAHSEDNIKVTHRVCNFRKHTRTPEQFKALVA